MYTVLPIQNISNVSKHFKHEHAGDVSALGIIGIETVGNLQRGGDRRRTLLNREGYCILTLNVKDLNYRPDLTLKF